MNPEKKKKLRSPAPTLPNPKLVVLPCKVEIELPHFKGELGGTRQMWGNIVLNRSVHTDRSALAQALREMADHVISTRGDPIDGAEIVVLLRRSRTPKL